MDSLPDNSTLSNEELEQLLLELPNILLELEQTVASTTIKQ